MWYLMLSHTDMPPVSDDVRKETLSKHFQFLRKQHEAGKILFSGPTPDRSLGIYVIKAGSHDEAEAIAAEDPMHVMKVRRAEIIDWEVHQIMGAGWWGN